MENLKEENHLIGHARSRQDRIHERWPSTCPELSECIELKLTKLRTTLILLPVKQVDKDINLALSVVDGRTRKDKPKTNKLRASWPTRIVHHFGEIKLMDFYLPEQINGSRIKSRQQLGGVWVCVVINEFWIK